MIFSIIVPFFNEQAHIERCIQSLLDQDFPKEEYEIIFIDNGSSDSSYEIVQAFSQITLLKDVGTGSFCARNCGLDVAQGEIIAFTDADCEVNRGWLQDIYKYMQQTGTEIVLGERLFAGKTQALQIFELYENTKSEYLLNEQQKNFYFAYTNNMAVKHQLFKKYGKFADHPHGGDVEFIHRFMQHQPDLSIHYLASMSILHLEITCAYHWLKKMFTYGSFYHVMCRNNAYQPLSYHCKLRVYRRFLQLYSSSLTKKLYALWILFLGDISYRLGIFRSYFLSKS